jgi:hypothetical protein
MPTRADLENIDRIVDKCLPDKAQAARMKQALHRDLESKPRPNEIPEDEVDDLWDNLPV